MIAFMLIIIGISGVYSSLFGRKPKKKNEKVFSLIVGAIFLAYGSYIVYLYFGGMFGRELLVGTRQKTAFMLVDTIGGCLFILSIIFGGILHRKWYKKDHRQ